MRFFPTGATRCTDGGEIWHEVEWSTPPCPPSCQISPHRWKDKSTEPQKLKILLNLGILTPHRGVSLAQFFKTKFAVFVVCFGGLAVRIWMGLLKGLQSYGVLS